MYFKRVFCEELTFTLPLVYLYFRTRRDACNSRYLGGGGRSQFKASKGKNVRHYLKNKHIFKIGSQELFAWTGCKHGPPDLCLLSS
jgi:hypothetical protein